MSMTREECCETRDHVEMMKNPDWWPAYPVLPLKRGHLGSKLEVGFMVDEKGFEYTVFKGSIFEIRDNFDTSASKTQYNSYEEIVQDGWEVD